MRTMNIHIRNIALYIVTLTFTVSFCFFVYTGERDIPYEIDKLFKSVDSRSSPGAAVAVLKNGEIVISRGYGMANLEYEIPITPETIFHVASVSKQFTAFAIAALADQGLISLDEDVRTYIPEFPDFGETLTVRQLAHHTSGLRDQWELLAMAGWRLDDVITKEHIFKMLKHQRELNFSPGEEYLYSNMGYSVLAEIVERVSGQSFQEWTHDNIFQPLGMNNTHFHEDHRHIVPNRAYSYSPDRENGFRKSVLSYANVGATSLFTTVEDLALWIKNFDTHQIGNERIFNLMHERGVLNNGDPIGYAFALQIGRYRGVEVVGHGGADAGFRSYVGRFPEHNFAVIVLSNLSSMVPQQIAYRIADVYLENVLEPADIRPETSASGEQPAGEDKPTPEQLTQYTGRYYSDELGTYYTIEIRDEKLIAVHRRHSDIELIPVIQDRFSGNQWWFRTIEFVRDGDEVVSGFRLTGGRVRNLWFEKYR